MSRKSQSTPALTTQVESKPSKDSMWAAYILNDGSFNIVVTQTPHDQSLMWTAPKLIYQEIPSGSTRVPASVQPGSSPAIAYWNGAPWVAYNNFDGLGKIYIATLNAEGEWTMNYTGLQLSDVSSPALTVFNGALYLSYVHSGSDIYVSSTTDGINWSTQINTGQRSPVDPTFYYSPAMTTFNGSLWIAYVADNGTNDIWICSSADGVTWNASDNYGTGQAANNNTYPSLTVFANNLWLGYIATGVQTNVSVCASSNGINWNSPTAIEWETQGGLSPALTTYNDYLWALYVSKERLNDNVLLLNHTINGVGWQDNSTPMM